MIRALALTKMKRKKKTNKQILQTETNKVWITKCVEKWGNKCSVCGEPATQVHHYIPKSRNGLLRYDIQNGIPICQKCHYKIHFSSKPSEVHRIIEKIRQVRGKEWCKYIDRVENIHGASFNTIQWVQKQLDKLNEK